MSINMALLTTVVEVFCVTTYFPLSKYAIQINKDNILLNIHLTFFRFQNYFDGNTEVNIVNTGKVTIYEHGTSTWSIVWQIAELDCDNETFCALLALCDGESKKINLLDNKFHHAKMSDGLSLTYRENSLQQDKSLSFVSLWKLIKNFPGNP